MLHAQSKKMSGKQMSENCVQDSRGYIRTQNITNFISSSSKHTQFRKKCRWNKICQIQPEKSEPEAKEAKSRAHVGNINVHDRKKLDFEFRFKFQFFVLKFKSPRKQSMK